MLIPFAGHEKLSAMQSSAKEEKTSIRAKRIEKYQLLTQEINRLKATNLMLARDIERLRAKVAHLSEVGRELDSLRNQYFSGISSSVFDGLHIDDVVIAVAKFYGMTVSQIKGRSNSSNAVKARHIAAYIASTLIGVGSPRIGVKLGDRDHSTILHAIDKIAKARIHNLPLDNDINIISSELKDRFKHSAASSPALSGSAPAISPSTDPAGAEPQLQIGT